jgi:hypothetical protein
VKTPSAAGVLSFGFSSAIHPAKAVKGWGLFSFLSASEFSELENQQNLKF